MLKEFEKTAADALEELKKVRDLTGLEDFRIKYLSRKGKITDLLSQVGKVPAELKPQAGKLANSIKKQVSDSFEQIKTSLSQSEKAKAKETFDVTIPGIAPSIGSKIISLRRQSMNCWRFSAGWVLVWLTVLRSKMNGTILLH